MNKICTQRISFKQRLFVLILSVIACLQTDRSNGQRLTVYGTVTDRAGKPLSSATILIRIAPSFTDTIALLTSVTGQFAFNDSTGTAISLTITHIGFKPLTDTLRETTRRQTDTFRLETEATYLPEDSVSPSLSFMTVQGNRKIFNADKIGGNSSGTAADVLQAVPLVSIDKDGNAYVHGQSANILIDGKPSPYSDISTTLQMIPAAMINKVEVIPNPSAKYDADGQGGIINIVLKKNTEKGMRGLINMDAGSHPDYHIGSDLSYRATRWRLYGNVNYHTRETRSAQAINQQFYNPSFHSVTETAQNLRHDRDPDSRIGIDLYLSDRTTLSLTQGLGGHASTATLSGIIDSAAYLKTPAFLAVTDTRINYVNRNLTSIAELTHHDPRSGDIFDATVMYTKINQHDNTKNTPDLRAYRRFTYY